MYRQNSDCMSSILAFVLNKKKIALTTLGHMAMCYFSHVLETRIPSLFQQCSQLKPTIHFHLAKLKSTNIQIPINNLQSQGVKIALMS